MKTNNFSLVKILCTLFLTVTFVGIQNGNAQFWKKNKQKEKKETAKKQQQKRKGSLLESSQKVVKN
jgi:hypothetical protein